MGEYGSLSKEDLTRLLDCLDEVKDSVVSIDKNVVVINQDLKNLKETNEKTHEELKETLLEHQKWARKNFENLYEKSNNNEKAIIMKAAPCENGEHSYCKPMKNLEEDAVTRFKSNVLWSSAIAGLVSLCIHVGKYIYVFI